MTPLFDRDEFIKQLAARFPEVASDVDDCSEGLLHLEMATFARATQAAINDGDTDLVKRYFTFADEIYSGATPDVENAVNVSYLENLHFDGRNPNRAKTRGLLSPRLSNALASLEKYLDELHKQDRDA